MQTIAILYFAVVIIIYLLASVVDGKSFKVFKWEESVRGVFVVVISIVTIAFGVVSLAYASVSSMNKNRVSRATELDKAIFKNDNDTISFDHNGFRYIIIKENLK